MIESVELLAYHRGYYSALNDIENGSVKVDNDQEPPQVHVTDEAMHA